jgi:hypothetical protein
MHVPRMLAIPGGLLLGAVAVLILFFLLPAFPFDSNDLGMTLVDTTVYVFVILAFFFGLFLVVEGRKNAKNHYQKDA